MGQIRLFLSTWVHLWSTAVQSMCLCACSALCASTTMWRRGVGARKVFNHWRAAHSTQRYVSPSTSPCLGPVCLFIQGLLFCYHLYVRTQRITADVDIKINAWFLLFSFSPYSNLQSGEPVRNMVIGIICAALVLIHLLVGLIAHKLDHLDSLRLSQVPLCGRTGLYHYRVLVKTGWRPGAGQPKRRH